MQALYYDVKETTPEMILHIYEYIKTIDANIVLLPNCVSLKTLDAEQLIGLRDEIDDLLIEMKRK